MFGGTISIPFVLAPSLCIADDPLIVGKLINTVFFVAGIATLLQSFLGNKSVFTITVLSMITICLDLFLIYAFKM